MAEELKLLGCPFCAGELEITKHFREAIYQGVHRCPVVGAINFDWTDKPERIAEAWNTRAPPSPEMREAVAALIVDHMSRPSLAPLKAWEADARDAADAILNLLQQEARS